MSAGGLLTREALADAVRRRIAIVVAAFALVSLFFIDSCTSCSPTITAQGQEVAVQQIAGAGGIAVALVLSLWSMVLGGILASDHLAEPLEDGSAQLLLARPVPRETYALTRLAGAWLLAAATAALLLGSSAVLLALRQELPAAPMLGAWLACVAGAWTVGALAMTASLWLPRAVTALLVFGGVWLLAGLEVAARLGADVSGLPGLVDRFGPPLASGILLALAGWIEPAAQVHGSGLAVALRAAVWCVLGTALLAVGFRRIELR